jgi:hypothetical protein
MRHTGSAVLLVIILISLASPGAAFELLRVGNTCDRGSRNLFWRLARVDVDESQFTLSYRQLADEARLEWNGAIRGFQFGTGQGEFCNIDDAQTALGFSATDCRGAGLGDALALTRLRWDDRSGELLDADIVFNVNADLLSNGPIFRQVAMHELGHVMGLDHSDACGSSGAGTLMRSFLSPSAPRITSPTADDIAGANAIYPGTPGGPPPEGANACVIAPSTSSWSALPIVLPALIVFWLRRRWPTAEQGRVNVRVSRESSGAAVQSSTGPHTRHSTLDPSDPTSLCY